MANSKISDLTAVTSVAAADTVPVVQGGVTKRATAAQILAAAPAGAGKSGIFHRNASLSIAANSIVTVPLTSTYTNDDTTYFTLGGGIVTIQKSGLYLISWFFQFASGAAAGTRTAFIQVNGTSQGESSVYTDGSELRLSANRVIRLAVNDAIALAAISPSATSTPGTSQKDTGISVTFLGN